MTATVILAVLVGQILFAAVGAFLWFRGGNKQEVLLDLPPLDADPEEDTNECLGILSRISNLLVSHQGTLQKFQTDGPDALKTQSTRVTNEVSRQLNANVERLDVVLQPYDDLYVDERSQLKDYAGRAESLDRLMTRENSSPETQAKLMQLIEKMQRENQELRATVAKCETEISDLIIRAIRSDRDARVDPLTRLPNRRAWTERKEAVAMEQSDFCVAVMDLDNFKGVNDNYGHAAGDAILRLVAKILRESPHATVYRNGGDEFVLLQNARSLDEGLRRMDAIRQRIEKASVYHEGRNLSITATMGVAHATCDEGLDSALKRADEALYEAKRLGRNRVEGYAGV